MRGDSPLVAPAFSGSGADGVAAAVPVRGFGTLNPGLLMAGLGSPLGTLGGRMRYHR